MNSEVKRRRIVENYLSSDDHDGMPCEISSNSIKVNELSERNANKYFQKLRKSYRNITLHLGNYLPWYKELHKFDKCKKKNEKYFW